MFDRDTVTSFVAALRFYETRLEEDIGRVQNDPDLAALLDQETIDSYPIGRVRNRIRGIREWFERLLTGQGALPVVNITLNHELVRLLKSVELLYLEHLRRKRDVIASSPTTSKALLEALDQQLAKFQEKTGLGIFKLATPSPLVVDQLPLIAPADQTTTVGPSSALPHERAPRPRAVVLDSIEIRDQELRRRCLDLLAQFQQGGEHDRLDTVVTGGDADPGGTPAAAG
jgi:hypothetical protein